MYSNPVMKSANGVVITTCTADSDRCDTRVRYLVSLAADSRVRNGLTVSHGGRLGTYDVRWSLGHKSYKVRVRTEAEAMAVAAERLAKIVAHYEAAAAKRAA